MQKTKKYIFTTNIVLHQITTPILHFYQTSTITAFFIMLKIVAVAGQDQNMFSHQRWYGGAAIYCSKASYTTKSDRPKSSKALSCYHVHNLELTAEYHWTVHQSDSLPNNNNNNNNYYYYYH